MDRAGTGRDGESPVVNHGAPRMDCLVLCKVSKGSRIKRRRLVELPKWEHSGEHCLMGLAMPLPRRLYTGSRDNFVPWRRIPRYSTFCIGTASSPLIDSAVWRLFLRIRILPDGGLAMRRSYHYMQEKGSRRNYHVGLGQYIALARSTRLFWDFKMTSDLEQRYGHIAMLISSWPLPDIRTIHPGSPEVFHRVYRISRLFLFLTLARFNYSEVNKRTKLHSPGTV